MRLSNLAGKRVVGWGAGVDVTTTIKKAHEVGAVVSFAQDDIAEGPSLVDGIAALYGDAALHELEQADVVIKSPGISPQHPVYKRLQSQGIKLTTSADLWLNENAGRTIGITGSKGKSTTASLLAHLLEALGVKTSLAGNIGVPFFSLPQESDWYVVELSSYQCHSLSVSPRVAVLTSLFPEHMTWHGTVENYYNAKLNLVANNPEVVVANGENPELRKRLPGIVDESVVHWTPSSHIAVAEQSVLIDGEVVASSDKTALLGRHNLVNAALCLSVLECIGFDLKKHFEVLQTAFASFAPLAHRLEDVGVRKNLRWINDSLAGNPEAAVVALQAFPDGAVTILVGGYDKGFDYQPLKDYLMQRSQPVTLITMPDNGRHIAEVLGDIPPHGIEHAGSLQEAILRATQVTDTGGVVLLSPGAPSFGHFKNFADRGDQFKKIVNNL